MSLREELLAEDDRPLHPISVWGKDLFVQSLSGEEQAEFDLAALDFNEKNKDRAARLKFNMGLLVVYSLVDADRKRVFETGDAEALMRSKKGPELRRIFNLAIKASGISDEAVEEIAKNSEAGPESDSSTGSPAT